MPLRERPRRELHPEVAADHRLVGEVEHAVGADVVQRGGECLAEIGPLGTKQADAAQVEHPVRPQLLRPARKEGRDDRHPGLLGGLERPPGHRRVVLTVDECEDLQQTPPLRLRGGAGYSAGSGTGASRCASCTSDSTTR